MISNKNIKCHKQSIPTLLLIKGNLFIYVQFLLKQKGIPADLKNIKFKFNL